MESTPQALRRFAGRAGLDSFPDFTVDPVAWNASWEAMASTLSNMHNIGSFYGEADEALLAEYRGAFEELCFLQHHLSLDTSKYYALGFEGKWRSTDPRARQRHMLEGHVRTCIMNEGDSERCYCGDINLASMGAGEGEAYLDLLRFYLLEDTTSPPTIPISYPYPGLAGQSITADIFSLARDLYICSFLHFTLASFYGKPRPVPGPFKKGYTKRKLTPKVKEVTKLAYGSMAVKGMKQLLHTLESEAVRFCESCGARESSPRFMHCRACKEGLGRRAYYCSRACQKDDWPRHKQICGKKLTLDNVRSSAIPPKRVAAAGSETHPEAVIQIGPAEGNYKRSPELIAQVHHLNTLDPTNIYFLINPRTEKFTPITVHHAAEMVVFRAVRDIAAKTGNRSAVAAIGQQLLAVTGNRLIRTVHDESADPQRINRSDIIAQLSREYGGPVEQDIAILEMITEHDDFQTQISKLANGSSTKLYDVTSVGDEWEALDELFRSLDV